MNVQSRATCATAEVESWLALGYSTVSMNEMSLQQAKALYELACEVRMAGCYQASGRLGNNQWELMLSSPKAHQRAD